jgi:hypothetical protein
MVFTARLLATPMLVQLLRPTKPMSTCCPTRGTVEIPTQGTLRRIRFSRSYPEPLRVIHLGGMVPSAVVQVRSSVVAACIELDPWKALSHGIG